MATTVQPEAGGSSQCLVRCAKPGGTEEDLPGHAASMHGRCAQPAAGPILPADGISIPADRGSEWFCDVLERTASLIDPARVVLLHYCSKYCCRQTKAEY